MEISLNDFGGQSAEKLTWDKTSNQVLYQNFELPNELEYSVELPSGYGPSASE